MSVFLKWGVFLMNLIPSLIDLMKKAEVEYPGSGNGATKLAFVRGIIDTLHDEIHEAWPLLEKVISFIVSFFNKTGKFASSSTPVVPPTN